MFTSFTSYTVFLVCEICAKIYYTFAIETNDV